MNDQPWDARFLDLFAASAERLRRGETDWQTHFGAEDIAFLHGIGCKPREFFDYVEDHVDGGSPTPGTALLVAAVRRAYFREVAGGSLSDREIRPEDLPAKTAELDGIPWLPRILAKARAKLRGELHPDIMYGCPGDRAFLRRIGWHEPDFLRLVWISEGDDGWVLGRIRETAASSPSA
jgi:hypothetical protein